jgi:hypothetical protein
MSPLPALGPDTPSQFRAVGMRWTASRISLHRGADARELDAETSNWLLESHPDHCLVEGIQIYTVGTCEKSGALPRSALNAILFGGREREVVSMFLLLNQWLV